MFGTATTSKDRTPSERPAVVFDASLEQYRTLALSLERSHRGDKGRVVVVTSALAGEGKTHTVTRLAQTLSDSFGRRVLLLDADLRNPTLHKMFDTPDIFKPGSVTGEAPPPGLNLGMTLGQASPTLLVLGVLNGTPPDPIRLLNSSDMQQLLAWARTRFDWILVDSPPALVPDTAVLAQFADGVLFVVSTASTPYEAARRAIENIGKQRVIGAVMNRVTDRDGNRTLHYAEQARSGHRSV
jgi:capsular exopolysaccharide synthesis family protein